MWMKYSWNLNQINKHYNMTTSQELALEFLIFSTCTRYCRSVWKSWSYGMLSISFHLYNLHLLSVTSLWPRGLAAHKQGAILREASTNAITESSKAQLILASSSAVKKEIFQQPADCQSSFPGLCSVSCHNNTGCWMLNELVEILCACSMVFGEHLQIDSSGS